MQTFNNYELGVAVMIEPVQGGYAGFKLTHVSFDVDHPEDGNHVVEVRKYPAGCQSQAIEYAKLCVRDSIPPGTFMRVG